MTLGQRIAAKRWNRSLRDIAAESGVSFSTLSRIEAGKDPDLATLRALCRWLRITPNEALCWRESEESAAMTENGEREMESVHFRESCQGDWSTPCGLNLPGLADDPPSTPADADATCAECLRRLANRYGGEAADHRRSMDYWLAKANRFHALADASALATEADGAERSKG